MRYPAAHKQASRDRILDAAARGFRAVGFDRASVASIMEDADLTHGAFYAHFDSKDDLVAAATQRAADQAGDSLEAKVAHLDGDAWVEAWVDLYLSDGHCAAPDRGCVLPSLSAELARSPEPARHAFRASMDRRLDRLHARLPFDADEAKRRLMSAYAHMAGALMIARNLDAEASARLRRDVAATVKVLLLGRDLPADAHRPGAAP